MATTGGKIYDGQVWLDEWRKAQLTTKDDPPRYTHWSIPQNSITWSGSTAPITGSHYSHIVSDDIGESSITQEGLEKALKWFKSRPEYAGEYDGRLWAGSMNPQEKPRGAFEELLDRFDDLHAEF